MDATGEVLKEVDALLGALEVQTIQEVTVDAATGWPSSWVHTAGVQLGPFGGSTEKATALRLPEP